MIIKIHESGEKKIVALCDEELIGNVYEEGELILDLSSNFYKGEKISEEDAENIIKKSYIINAVGKNCVAFLKKIELINDDEIKEIKNIPFVQVVIDKEN